MRFGLRLPSFALGVDPPTLAEMGAYLRDAEDLGFDSALLIDHLLVIPRSGLALDSIAISKGADGDGYGGSDHGAVRAAISF